ncbi:MAG: AAA family ATPase [Candidatus Zixiibacteriota bacterium]
MAGKLTVVVIDSEKSSRKTLRDLLDQQGNLEVACVAKGQDEAFPAIRASKPHVLILELPKDSDKTLKWIERMKLEFPDISIFVSSADKSPDLVISAMRAGVQEFLSRPINSDELKKAINKVFKTREQARAQAPTRGKVISVFSKKGGLGVTTLAVNLGSALARVAENKAALIDLDLQLGDVTSFLNLSPEYSILDVLDEDGGVDAVKLQSCMTRHESGVFVLSEPKNPADSENVSSSQINQILRHLRSTFSYVLVDTPHNFDSKTLEVFELSDHIIVVVVPNVSSIRAARRTLGVFKQLGFLRDKVKVVVNRVGKKDSVRVDDVEKTLRYPVSWVVPNNYPVAIDAVNSGVPLVNHKGDSNLAKSILELANDIPEWSRSLYVELKD